MHPEPLALRIVLRHVPGMVESQHRWVRHRAPIADQENTSASMTLPHDGITDPDATDAPIAFENGRNVAQCERVDDGIWRTRDLCLRAGEQDVDIGEVGEACEMCEKCRRNGLRIRTRLRLQRCIHTSLRPYLLQVKVNPNCRNFIESQQLRICPTS
jgi:hypothetical protein